MIISLEEFAERLNSDKNLINKKVEVEELPQPQAKPELEIKELYNGGGNSIPLPPAIKQLVAVEAHFRSAKEVAADYGLHPSSVGNIKLGLRGMRHNGDQSRERDELSYRQTQERVTGVKSDIVSRALDRMLEGLEGVKVDGTKVDLNKSATIRNLSTIVGNLTEKNEIKDNRVQVVIMSPGVARIEDFDKDAIEVGGN